MCSGHAATVLYSCVLAKNADVPSLTTDTLQEAVYSVLQHAQLLPHGSRPEDLNILQFGHGQSNPTYLLQVCCALCT